MSFIPLNAIGQAGITMNPPWAGKLFSLRRTANPPGIVPERLKGYIKGKGSAPVAALKVVLARGGTSGGNAKTRRGYARRGISPTPAARLVGSAR